ncbi:recombinase family protein [Streptomyces sp. H39-S7]|uniref:recombinase family protein n=1 Tax=Streptomyces sp. H39-S7 TaxID=3004357 RepID=UPI0022AF5067|nr:recombinase family protein [Streptomyces sp. H39-S7]MCZ4122574.1 recombinase family protein [Streptomyces sp. H39-S7]
MARVLGALRLSRASDESTSVVRQKAAIQRWADSRGDTVVGWVEDVDVSGAIAPWERPGLGQWLPSTIGKDVSAVELRLAWEISRVDEWDILCGMKLDRISRRVLHIAQLVEWAGKHNKEIAAAEDGFDLSSPMGKILFQLIAAFAEGELEAIKFRAKSSYAYLMKTGRWRGGFVPYGYRAEKDAEGDGWKLVPDEYGTETAKVVREVVRRTLEGEATNAVCRWLNESKTPSPLDAQRIRSGKESKGAVWRVGNLLKMLRSHTLLGRVEMTEEVILPDGTKEKRTRLVRDAEGLPLQRAEPLISKEEWDQLQAKLKENSNPRAGNRFDRSPLLRVAYCTCGKALYRNNGRNQMYYRCSSRNITGAECDSTEAIQATLLEKVIEEAFLKAVGHAEIVRRVFRPGVDHTQDVTEVTRALAELREDREAGLYSSELSKKEFREEYLRLEAKRETLAAMPVVPDHWEETSTGQTYADRWAQLTTSAEKNKELREAGVKAIVHTRKVPPMTAAQLMEPKGHEGMWQHAVGRVQLLMPMNLRDRVRSLAAEHIV